jgi:predicted nucleic acid-binding protein
MRYLVDANVLSEPTKPSPNPKVAEWLRAHEADLVVDPVILGELSAGILALPAGAKRRRLEQWFADVVGVIECVPWDAAVGLRWARLVVALKRKGTPIPILDSMIAATAAEHGFVVGTRNARDFAAAGVQVVDPFA